MPQENGHRRTRHSSQSSQVPANSAQNGNGLEKGRSNRDMKERGYYSELATINPESTFEVTSSHSRPLSNLSLVLDLDRTTSTRRS